MERRNYLEDLGVDEVIILKSISNSYFARIELKFI
jgi:hypothetical protein